MTPSNDQLFVLDNFEGPLDLLVYLVHKSEIDITSLHTEAIAAQLLDMVSRLPTHLAEKGHGQEQCPSAAHRPSESTNRQSFISSGLDCNADHLALAASLVHLKSIRLLPSMQADGEEAVDDSRLTILEHIVEYCQLRDFATLLEERHTVQGGRHPRPPPIEPTKADTPPPPGIEHLEIRQLYPMVEEALKRAIASKPRLVTSERWRVADAIQHVRQILPTGANVPFFDLLLAKGSKEAVIVTFLAILELMKGQEIVIIGKDQEFLVSRKERKP